MGTYIRVIEKIRRFGTEEQFSIFEGNKNKVEEDRKYWKNVQKEKARYFKVVEI
jgi:hypothetical protein